VESVRYLFIQIGKMDLKKEKCIDGILNQFIEAKRLKKVKCITVRWAGTNSPTPYEVRVEFDIFVPIDSIVEIQDLLEEKYENFVSNVQIYTPFQLPAVLSFFVSWTPQLSVLHYKKSI
jgi:hypothetical protein